MKEERKELKEVDELLVHCLCQTALANRSAFKMLYDRSSPVLLSIIKRIVIDIETAEDVLQETFIKVWYQAQSYRSDKSKPMTWLASIARNCAIDTLRKNKKRSRTYSLDETAFEHADERSYTSAEEGVGNYKLIGCMNKLEPEQRKAILASYCEGYSHRELSESLGTPIGTVKSWIRRSLLTLKKCLGQ